MEAVRRGRYKLHVPHEYRVVDEVGMGGVRGTYRNETIGRVLFDLVADPSERYDLSGEYPDLVAELQALVEAHEEEVLATAVEAYRPG